MMSFFSEDEDEDEGPETTWKHDEQDLTGMEGEFTNNSCPTSLTDNDFILTQSITHTLHI